MTKMDFKILNMHKRHILFEILKDLKFGDKMVSDAYDEILKLSINDSLPTFEESKKAMLRKKSKFVLDMDRFSTIKNAYKKGWQDCFNWIKLKEITTNK